MFPLALTAAVSVAADPRPFVVVVVAEDEYRTETTLPAFAGTLLAPRYRVGVVVGDPKQKTRLPGAALVNVADVVILSVRRRPLLEADMKPIRDYLRAGKPLVALRTSSHAFAPPLNAKTPPDTDPWPTFDRDVLGCNYTGHYPNKVGTVVTPAGPHELLAGWPAGPTAFRSWLYKSKPLAADCTELLRGTVGTNPPEPVAWVREKAPGRGRVFYTGLGHEDDFKTDAFPKLLAAAVDWVRK